MQECTRVFKCDFKKEMQGTPASAALNNACLQPPRQDSPIADLIGKCLMEVSALSEPLTTNAKYAPTPLMIKKTAIHET